MKGKYKTILLIVAAIAIWLIFPWSFPLIIVIAIGFSIYKIIKIEQYKAETERIKAEAKTAKSSGEEM